MPALSPARALGLILCPMLIAACLPKGEKAPEGADTGTSTGGDQTVSRTEVGPQGGVAISPDGRFEVHVPPGALDSTVEITVAQVDASTVDAAGATIDGAYELGPDGQSFSETVELRFAVDAAANAEIARVVDGALIPLHRRSPLLEPGFATGLTTHFSLYVPVIDWPAIPCDDGGGGGGGGAPGPDPCECDQAAVADCAQELGIAVLAGGCGWTYVSFPVETYDNGAKLYDAYNCYEQATGFELIRNGEGATACERNCCEASGGNQWHFDQGQFRCFLPDGVETAQACVSTCASNGDDKTECELASGGGGGDDGACEVCGDGKLTGLEQCDPTYEFELTCELAGAVGGVIPCNPDCTLDISVCSLDGEPIPPEPTGTTGSAGSTGMSDAGDSEDDIADEGIGDCDPITCNEFQYIEPESETPMCDGRCFKVCDGTDYAFQVGWENEYECRIDGKVVAGGSYGCGPSFPTNGPDGWEALCMFP